MDRIKETANLVSAIHQFQKSERKDYEVIKLVCSYFDVVKNEQINHGDLQFLKYISNIIGIPHFYDLLDKFNKKSSIEVFNLNTLGSIIYESTLHTEENTKVHKYQKEILDIFQSGRTNRYFLSASTSFGKTHVVFEIIKKMKYKNIVLIFPTIALLSENLEKINSNSDHQFFQKSYKVHTLSEINEFGDNNIFIFTPERFLSYIEKNNKKLVFDFFFIDEVYKIDNDYIIDEEVKENERDVAYRLAVHYTLKENADVLFAGPYIDFSKPNDTNYNESFELFLKENGIQLLDYNRYEIVNKTLHDIKTSKSIKIDDDLEFVFDKADKTTRLLNILSGIRKINQNLIVYCSTKGKRGGVEFYASKIIKSDIYQDHDYSGYSDFIKHIEKNFTKDWILVNALRHGIGIHHGLVPKYIQKEIVSLFNDNTNSLRALLSTTTITEGVNTSAKNLLVLHDTKGDKPLKKFDAKNIAGRAGRFLYHYSGRVLALQNKFLEVIDSESGGIKHKNYDISSPKDEIDLFYTSDKYLSSDDQLKLSDIKKQQSDRNLPDSVFEQFKVVSRIDKIQVYDAIVKLTPTEHDSIRRLISTINSRMDIDYDGFQAIIGIIGSIVRNEKVKFLIEHKGVKGQYSTLTNLVHYYLVGGFVELMQYKIAQGDHVDVAIRDTAEFIYNLLKYQAVKYLGVFNIMYKYYVSQQSKKPIEEVSGIDRLLIKMEYNALTEEGRIASDYGVPSSIIDYYERKTEQEKIKSNFDEYEKGVFNKVDKIIQRK